MNLKKLNYKIMRQETQKQVSQFIKELESHIADAEKRHKEASIAREEADADITYLSDLKQSLYAFHDSPKLVQVQKECIDFKKLFNE